jgi:hypothetical protein
MPDAYTSPDEASRALCADATLHRLREAIMAGLPNGKRLLELRRVEAAIGRAETMVQEILTASTPDRVDAALGSVIAAAWRAIDDGPVGDPAGLQRLFASWSSGGMPDAQRRLFDRFMAGGALQQRLRAHCRDLAPQPAGGEPAPDVAARLDELVDLLSSAVETSEPRHLDATLGLVMAAQRRALAVPDGPEAAARFQELATAYAGDMSSQERALFERNMTAFALLARLRATHSELLRPEPPPTEAETRLMALLDERIPALREAQAHTMPGEITGEWLDRLAGLLEQFEETLAVTPAENRRRPLLCFYAASGAYALGRGREQKLQPKAAREAYARAGDLYEEAGEAEDAAVAREKAAWLGFALLADVDGGSFDDLSKVAEGIPDPLDRAATLGRQSAQATQANDHFGAQQYAEAAAAALTEAGFRDPGNEPIDSAMAAWVEAAASRREGNETLKLIQRVGDRALRILLAWHTATIKADPERARTLEATLERFQRALTQLLEQSGPVMAEIHEGLKPYVKLRAPREDQDGSRNDALRALMAEITALGSAAQSAAEPTAAARAQADALAAAAEGFGQPGPIAQARRVQSVLRRRNGDLDGAEAAAEAGEAALLPDGAGPVQLVDRSLFDAFLMLRSCRCGIAAAANASERVLDLSEEAIRAIEADRYRISDPIQQGRFLSDRTQFYELAAVSAFKLERWDSLIEIMDLMKSRAALCGRLAAPSDQSVAELARRVAEDTRAIEAAPPERRDALREHRRKLWGVLAIARMRSAAGQNLPALTLAAVQSALSRDEAVVS